MYIDREYQSREYNDNKQVSATYLFEFVECVALASTSNITP